jgi:hypothetical protein
MGWSRSKIHLVHKKGGYGTSLQALLRELAAFNIGLCVTTTRMPVADLSDHEGSSALRRNLEHLSSHAGVQLLRALGVKGDEAELRSRSATAPVEVGTFEDGLFRILDGREHCT